MNEQREDSTLQSPVLAGSQATGNAARSGSNCELESSGQLWSKSMYYRKLAKRASGVKAKAMWTHVANAFYLLSTAARLKGR